MVPDPTQVSWLMAHGLYSTGDWICAHCGDLQFARNVQCRMCGAQRVVDVSQLGGYQLEPERQQRASSQGFRAPLSSSGQNGSGSRPSGGGQRSHNSAEARAQNAVVTETIECPNHLAGAVIGRHGATIAQLRRETQCHIEIEASSAGGASRSITIWGPKSAVEDAISRIKTTMEERIAAGFPEGSGRQASEEDRSRTSDLLDSLDSRGILKRSWLDERVMEVITALPYDISSRVLCEAERVDLWKTRNVSAFLMMLVKIVQQNPDGPISHRVLRFPRRGESWQQADRRQQAALGPQPQLTNPGTSLTSELRRVGYLPQHPAQPWPLDVSAGMPAFHPHRAPGNSGIIGQPVAGSPFLRPQASQRELYSLLHQLVASREPPGPPPFPFDGLGHEASRFLQPQGPLPPFGGKGKGAVAPQMQSHLGLLPPSTGLASASMFSL